MTKIYFPDDPPIQVHQSRVKQCPELFPKGFYWYGSKRHGPGRPPKNVQKKLEQIAAVLDQPANLNKDPLAEIVTDDSNGEDSRSTPDSIPVLKQQVTSPQSTVRRPEKEAKKSSHRYDLRRKNVSLGSGSK